MQIEVRPQPRIDALVTAVAGGNRRRTEYCGTAWIGTAPSVHSRVVVRSGAGIAPDGCVFWLPDGLAYRTADCGSAVVSVTAAVQSAREATQILDVAARLDPHPEHPDVSYVAVTVTASGAAPLGVSYRVIVLADEGAVLS